MCTGGFSSEAGFCIDHMEGCSSTNLVIVSSSDLTLLPVWIGPRAACFNISYKFLVFFR